MNIKNVPIIFFLTFAALISAAQDKVNDDEASSYNRNKPEREEWLRNTNSGLFIHFSADAQLGIVISHSLVGASADYVNRYFSELPASFNPSKFDPAEIASLAKLAGMKYIMFTTKHHSGFCMWDTKTTSYNIMNTAYHKDLLQEFVDATRKAGLQVGFYFSPEDFNFYYRHKLPISRDTMLMSTAIKEEFDDFTRKQCEELMTHYGKIDLLFIDGEPKEIVKETCWKLQPDILITRGALKTPEQMLPGITVTEPWLSCITMGTAWQYQPSNERYKPGTMLIELLIEARSKGGSLLLNIGPKSNGAIADEQEARLREMAAWYFINREAVDNVRSWVINKEKNIWYTSSINKKSVYAIFTNAAGWPEGERKEIILHALKATDSTKIGVLGQNSLLQEYKPGKDVSCRFRQTDTGLVVSIVKAQRIYDDHKWPGPVVIKLENILPAVEPVQVITGTVKPTPGTVLFNGKVVPYRSRPGLTAWFYYRVYHGQTEDLYSGEWIKSGTAVTDASGNLKLLKNHVKKGLQYEYKAVVLNNRIEIEGDKKIFLR